VDKGKAELGDVVGESWKQRLSLRRMVIVIHLLSAFVGIRHLGVLFQASSKF
jgi:hypothetical protein